MTEKTYNHEDNDSIYQTYFYDNQTRGSVLIHPQHNLNDSELFIAMVFAKQGQKVKLLNEQAAEGIKTPDAEINEEIWEFKELSAKAVSIKNTIQRGLAIGKKRASNIAYHINNNQADIKDINRGIARALIWDREQFLQKIVLIFNNGTVKIKTREELNNGKYFQ